MKENSLNNIINDLDIYNTKIKKLNEFKYDTFKKNIENINFICNQCGYCCTKESNDEVFLLDLDTKILKKKYSNYLCIPHTLDYCDQYGNFYVSGYSLKINNDKLGSCIFLINNKCAIYNDRPLICKIFPYMITSEKISNKYKWNCFGGIDEHGSYDFISKDNINYKYIFKITKKYEQEAILQEIRFRKYLLFFFNKYNLYYTRKKYDYYLSKINRKKITSYNVFVYYNNTFEKIVLGDLD